MRFDNIPLNILVVARYVMLLPLPLYIYIRLLFLMSHNKNQKYLIVWWNVIDDVDDDTKKKLYDLHFKFVFFLTKKNGCVRMNNKFSSTAFNTRLSAYTDLLLYCLGAPFIILYTKSFTKKKLKFYFRIQKANNRLWVYNDLTRKHTIYKYSVYVKIQICLNKLELH